MPFENNADAFELQPQPVFSPFFRGVSLLLTVVFFWVFTVFPASAAVTEVVQANHAKAVARARAEAKVSKAIKADMAKHKPVLMMAQSPKVVPVVQNKLTPLHTLLDEGGRLIRKVGTGEVVEWKAQIVSSTVSAPDKAQAHDYLGEWRLDDQKDPLGAIHEFAVAEELSAPSQATHGLALYDTAITHFRSGAYRNAGAEFHELVVSPHTAGYDREECALWDRHAQACDGYHRAHAKLGIPEPTKLDPFCGAAAIATALRFLSLPYDRSHVATYCRVTGLGSTLRDLVKAGPGLGVNIRPVTATDEGLKALPKPLIAYVERDHFIAVTKADVHGVSYLCSDCGPWPGGEVNLTWMQWHTMNPGIYATVTKVGSTWDNALADKMQSDLQNTKSPIRAQTQVASIDLNAKIMPYLPALPVLKGVTFKADGWWPWDDITCGYSGYFGGECAQCLVCCIMDSPGTGSPTASQPLANASGASEGDPVNLATGGEEYTPDPDLVVYNPHGPSVTWQRLYNSLRSFDERDAAHQAYWSYEYIDYGYAWSQQYNISVAIGSSTDYLILPNGSRIGFTATAPTASTPVVNCTVQQGAPLLIQWKYNASTSSTYFTVTWQDRTVWTTTTSTSGYGGGSWQLAKITDRNGNSIYFNYATTAVYGFYLLNSITDQPNGAGTQLLTIGRDNTGCIISITDCYGRSVYYHVLDTTYIQTELFTTDYVSQIVPTCSTNVPVRYQYGYIDRANSEGDHPAAFLHTISVPSPTGTGMSTATINYVASGPPFVASLTDANGNTRSYSQIDQLDTQVIVTNPAGATVYSYTGTYDNNMSGVAATDGAGQLLGQRVYADPNDPYRPSASLDAIAARAAISSNSIYSGYSAAIGKSGSNVPPTGTTWQVLNSSGTVVGSSNTTNGWSVSYNSGTMSFSISVPTSTTAGSGYQVEYASVGSATFSVLSPTSTGWGITNYTWDQYGNELTETSPRGTVNANTYSYSNFNLGELTETQTGSKSPTAYTFYEPSGLVNTIQKPVPGTIGSSSHVTYSYTYNGNGDVTQFTGPGNNSVSSITMVYYYGSSPAIGQPLTVMDNLGNITTYTYDSQANLTSVTDANSNETYYGDTTGHNGYNIANQPILTTYPATGQSGSGNSQDVTTYLYPGGQKLTDQSYDESGTEVEQVNEQYGQEGEALSVAGGTEPAVYTYDAQYRTASLTDGDGRTTIYTYHTTGYLARTNYPGSGDATSGSDTLQYTSYDADGDLTQRIDGNNVTTNYSYNDPERKLTSVAYPASTAINIDCSYDSYGRRTSMSDGTGSITYVYDDTNKKTSVVTTYTGLSPQTIGYNFYADGSKETMTTPAGNFSYDYDGGSRLTSLTNPNSETTTWTYQSNTWLSTQTLSNGVTTDYTYNALGLKTDLVNKTSGGTTLSDFGSITYNGIGDLTAVTASLPSVSSYSGVTNYSYDTISSGGTRSQLIGEASTRIGGYTNTNAYDNAGNSTTFRSTTMPPYNSDNQTTAFGFSFDGNGNPTTYNGNSLTFDAEDRMVGFGSSMTAGYNGDSLRAWKSNSSGTTYYLYDETQPVCELNSSGIVTAVNTFADSRLISRSVGITSKFYTFDSHGSPAQMLDSSADILATSMFDAFGNRIATSSMTDPFSGYDAQSGYYFDSETGLEYCTWRYYDSTLGRFINRDPIGFSGGTDLYEYCGNNAVDLSDPIGLLAGGIGPPGASDNLAGCIAIQKTLLNNALVKCKAFITNTGKKGLRYYACATLAYAIFDEEVAACVAAYDVEKPCQDFWNSPAPPWMLPPTREGGGFPLPTSPVYGES